MLGRAESCVYVVEGTTESMIISGGMSYLVPSLLEQFDTFGIDPTRITKLLILHAHFDHVGIVPFFKRRYPHLNVYASARGWEILEMVKARRIINEFSRAVSLRMGKEGVCDRYDVDWRDDVTGNALSEGDRLELGNLDVLIHETPGHSSCSITAYVPQLKALFASDAGGIPYKETILTYGNSNFTMYQQSLEKIKDLDAEYVCADHYGCVVGAEAKDFTRATAVKAREYRALLEKTYRRTGDIQTAARELASAFQREHPDNILTREISEEVIKQMIQHIAHGD